MIHLFLYIVQLLSPTIDCKVSLDERYGHGNDSNCKPGTFQNRDTCESNNTSSFHPYNDNLDARTNELSDQELLMTTRREIMALGTKLGKTNIAARAIKDGEDRNVSSLLKTNKALQPNTTVTETRAAAWEDAEKAKYLSRFKREEIKIEA